MLSIEEVLGSLERKAEQYSVENLIYILQKCRKEKIPLYAKHVHIHICNNGLEAHRVLGNYLVPMLVECGGMSEAQHAFNKLVYRNEYSWTALIQGYIEGGELERALNLYQKMQQDCVYPSKHTFVALLKACARLKCLGRGRQIHAEVVQGGYLTDNFVGSTLVDMYAKCGSLEEAQDVFDELPAQDIISWNALIAGYAEHGLGKEALITFKQMQVKGLSPDAVTFLSSLRACGRIRAIDNGRDIHAEIAKLALEMDSFLSHSLVDMYAKCGSFVEAQEILIKLPVQDVVLWTVLIAAFAEHGFGEEGLKCFQQMQLDGVSPNAVTFVCSLKACGSLGTLDRGYEIHAEIATQGFDQDVFIASTLVDTYAKCGSLVEAQEVFGKLLDQNTVSWTTLITGYAEQGLGEEALKCFQQMQLEGTCPNSVTLICSLKACGSIGVVHRGREIHTEIARRGYERDCVIGNCLVDMYAKCGSLAEAQEVLDKLPVRDVVSWTALIAGYSEHGLADEAVNHFQQMQLEGVSPDVVPWNAIILCFAEQGECEQAFRLFAQMEEQGMSPNSMTFASILKACGNAAFLDKGKIYQAQICRIGGLEALEEILAIAVIDMYCKCGSMDDAQWMFDGMPTRVLGTWNALISGYACQGESEVVFHSFARMREEGIQPDGITFLSILIVCSHAGLVEKGQKCFGAMCEEYGITPTIKHHNCMVDLLGRAGQFDKAVMMLVRMPFQPDLVVWNTMLNACRNWGNIELGRWAFECAVILCTKHAAPYILMSNIYSDAHMWEDAKKIEALRLKLCD